MVDIVFLVGFVGSGKTTYAKELTDTLGAFRFTTDEWMLPLFGEHQERSLFDQRLDAVQSLFLESALQLYRLGVPVIIDSGFWRKSDRRRVAQWAAGHGLRWQFHYLEMSFQDCCTRALARNATAAGRHYQMTAEMLSELWELFEAPVDEDLIRVEADRSAGGVPGR